MRRLFAAAHAVSLFQRLATAGHRGPAEWRVGQGGVLGGQRGRVRGRGRLERLLDGPCQHLRLGRLLIRQLRLHVGPHHLPLRVGACRQVGALVPHVVPEPVAELERLRQRDGPAVLAGGYVQRGRPVQPQHVCEEDGRGVQEEAGPHLIVVAVERHQVLVAGVRVQDEPGVVRPHERVVVGSGEDRRHEAGGGVVDGPALVDVERGPSLDGRGHQPERRLD
mmetsp:Transcript_15524/g.50688  ORF Transcript_15524/g.50688 Transcript_15524/m.50688 type:complete len:222 (+) Transcript_15524:349-1014(+)